MKQHEYEVLSPWSDAVQIPLSGLSPRLTGLEGKTIGLLTNVKRAAPPILTVVEQRLRERFPNLKTSRCEGRRLGLDESDDPELQGFREWIKGVDVVIAAVGD